MYSTTHLLPRFTFEGCLGAAALGAALAGAAAFFSSGAAAGVGLAAEEPPAC